MGERKSSEKFSQSWSEEKHIEVVRKHDKPISEKFLGFVFPLVNVINLVLEEM